MKPTQKGITFSVENYENLKKMIPTIDKLIEKVNK